eukprot:1050747-Amphidinium_carterae.2
MSSKGAQSNLTSSCFAHVSLESSALVPHCQVAGVSGFTSSASWNTLVERSMFQEDRCQCIRLFLLWLDSLQCYLGPVSLGWLIKLKRVQRLGIQMKLDPPNCKRFHSEAVQSSSSNVMQIFACAVSYG